MGGSLGKTNKMRRGRNNALNDDNNGVTAGAHVKMVVLGAGGVGKSALIIRFCMAQFVMEYDPTIEDNYRKQVSIDGDILLLDILDTAGQAEYQSLRDQYTYESRIFFLVFSVTSQASFAEVESYFETLKLKEEDDFVVMLVGNKIDLIDEREVSREEAERYAEERGFSYMELSAKTTPEVVEDMFINNTRYLKNGNFIKPDNYGFKNIKKAR